MEKMGYLHFFLAESTNQCTCHFFWIVCWSSGPNFRSRSDSGCSLDQWESTVQTASEWAHKQRRPSARVSCVEIYWVGRNCTLSVVSVDFQLTLTPPAECKQKVTWHCSLVALSLCTTNHHWHLMYCDEWDCNVVPSLSIEWRESNPTFRQNFIIFFLFSLLHRACCWVTQLLYQLLHIYRVSQEECARLREGVPYVKVYRYNPKHLFPKLNGYGDNGQRKVGASCCSKYCNLHSWYVTWQC